MAYIGPEPNPGQNREVDDISSSFNGSTTAFTLQVASQNVSPGSANAIIVSLGGVVQNPGTDYTVAASTLTFTTAPASGLAFFGLVLGQQVDTEGFADGGTLNNPVITGDLSIADKIVHTGDTNNAIRFPASDTITAETGGSERVRVDSSGRVGIGTNNPSQKLHLKDTAPMAQIESSSYSSFVGTAEANDNIGNGTKAGNLVLRGQTGIAISGNGGTATQVKIDADGLKFGTDTAAANALDDYEEGTWTPAITQGATSINNARYTKIGNLCTIHFFALGFSNNSSGDAISFNGLPFTSASDNVGVGSVFTAKISVNGNVVAYVGSNNSNVQFFDHSTGDYDNVRYNNINGTDTTHRIFVNLTYRTA